MFSKIRDLEIYGKITEGDKMESQDIFLQTLRCVSPSYMGSLMPLRYSF